MANSHEHHGRWQLPVTLGLLVVMGATKGCNSNTLPVQVQPDPANTIRIAGKVVCVDGGPVVGMYLHDVRDPSVDNFVNFQSLVGEPDEATFVSSSQVATGDLVQIDVGCESLISGLGKKEWAHNDHSPQFAADPKTSTQLLVVCGDEPNTPGNNGTENGMCIISGSD